NASGDRAGCRAHAGRRDRTRQNWRISRNLLALDLYQARLVPARSYCNVEPIRILTMIALFSAPFRPLFLAAALHGLVSIVLWGAFLAHGIGAIPALDPFLWHGHEMLTGFAGA